MNALNSTYQEISQTSIVNNEEDVMIEKESPPNYVTIRKVIPNNDLVEFRKEFQSFRSTILSMLETWFTKQDTTLASVHDEISDLKTSLKYMNEAYEDLKIKTEDISKRVSILEEKVTSYSSNPSHITLLENKLEIMEQQTRITNVEISNLPEKRGENLSVILMNIAGLVKQRLNEQDVISVHRVQQAKIDNARPKNIVVKFATRILRDNFISAVRLNKGITSTQLGITPAQKVYINEHLTLKNKILFRETREAAKRSGVRFVWIKHGTILTRANETSPVIAIRSESDLSKIKIKS